MSECLHCEINELVKERIEQGAVDVAELTSMIVESLAELILLAPEDKQSKLMAEVCAFRAGHFGKERWYRGRSVERDTLTDTFDEESSSLPPTRKDQVRGAHRAGLDAGLQAMEIRLAICQRVIYRHTI